jgi:predicted Zn-dependent protease
MNKTFTRLGGLALCAALFAAAPASSQDLGRALGGLLRGGVPGIGGGAAAPAAAGGDLFQLLSQSSGTIDEAKEIEIGRQLAAVLLGAKPLHPDMQLQRYVNRLGRWISLQSTRPQLPWTFAVLDDPGFNAFAAPGGYIFVTKGLVDRVDEAELAGILAHEITHVTDKHHLNALRTKARAGVVTSLIGSQLRNDVGGLVSQQLLSLFKNVYSAGLDQADEFDADRNGVALAARAGFDPYGLPSILQQLRTATPDNALFALTLSTHPPAQQRLEYLELAMGQRLDRYSGKPSVSVAQRLRGR